MSSPENVSSMTRWIVDAVVGEQQLMRHDYDDSTRDARVLVDEVDDLLHRRARQKDPA